MTPYEQARHRASRYLPRGVFDFIDGGAGTESAVVANLDALRRVTITPRVLRGTGTPMISARFLGKDYAGPFGVCPMGLGRIAGPKTDIVLARAAGKAKIPYSLSMVGSSTIEELAEVADGYLWFQLYLCNDVKLTDALLERARRAGVETLLLTVDANFPGQRYRDVRNGFGMPFRPNARTVVDFALHPRWTLSTLRHGTPGMKFVESEIGTLTTVRLLEMLRTAQLDMDALKRIRDRWQGKLAVKGVLSPDDAKQIIAAGADGIIVSNHGGRQLDGVIPSIDALPAIREAVGPDVDLALDSGVRGGEDVLKTLLRGGNFAMLGRPFLFAAGCADPEAGVAGFIESLVKSTTAAMAQAGYSTVSQASSQTHSKTTGIA